MNRLTKCQIAELIEDSLVAQGLRGKTLPFVWAGMLFGSLFESRVPMESMSLRQSRNVALWLVLMAPLIVVTIVLAAPFELLRSRRAEVQNARMKALLTSGGPKSGSGDASPGEGERVIVNYRIESEGRAVFVGTALVARDGERRDLLGFTVHRGNPPLQAIDGEAVMRALAERGPLAAELCHWQWNLLDPYEIVERPARPW